MFATAKFVPVKVWLGVLGRGNQTVVIYMGVSTAPATAARLIDAGRAASTPVLITENASLEGERRVVTTLGALPNAVEGLEGPAILIIGEVAAMADVAPVILTETEILRGVS